MCAGVGGFKVSGTRVSMDVGGGGFFEVRYGWEQGGEGGGEWLPWSGWVVRVACNARVRRVSVVSSV